jgi:hypothetical protein
MRISELFEKIQERFLPEDLNGEFILQGNCIVWTYNLDNDSQEIDVPDDDEEESPFSFEATSAEELLQEAYEEDHDLLEEFLDELEEYDNWTFSDPETTGNIISFRIF